VTPGGRGATAIADWTANKQIETPDFRGVGIVGLAAMGNANSGRLASTFAGNADTLGAFFGVDAYAMLVANLPAHSHPVSIPAGQGSHAHNYDKFTDSGSGAYQNGPFPGQLAGDNVSTPSAAGVLPAMTGTAENIGSGTPTPIIQPSRLVTVYFRL
jgi:hypothetical protein